jgi:hypothetical protein
MMADHTEAAVRSAEQQHRDRPEITPVEIELKKRQTNTVPLYTAIRIAGLFSKNPRKAQPSTVRKQRGSETRRREDMNGREMRVVGGSECRSCAESRSTRWLPPQCMSSRTCPAHVTHCVAERVATEPDPPRTLTRSSGSRRLGRSSDRHCYTNDSYSYLWIILWIIRSYVLLLATVCYCEYY